MHISTEMDRLSELYLWLDGLGEVEDPVKESADLIDISDEAKRMFEESGLEPLDNFSLKELDKRIAVVRQQIQELWGSSLPKKEKYSQIRSKEIEISLLQAGQFSFAKSMLSRSA